VYSNFVLTGGGLLSSLKWLKSGALGFLLTRYFEE